MMRYFFLECKRLARYLPVAVLVAALLVGALAGLLGGAKNRQERENQKFPIGVVGSLDDPLLQMGVEAIRTYDSSSLALELVEMDEETAKRQLALGRISAYMVVPDGFMESAMSGTIQPIRFVSTMGAGGLTGVMQREVTDTVARFLLDAQKGVYGMYDVTKGAGGGHMTDMALEYTEFVLVRDQLYQVEALGIGDGLDLSGYLLRGFLVLLVLLCCLPFAPALVREDHALGQLLCAKGRAPFLQSLCVFLAFCLVLGLMVLALGILALCIPPVAEFGKLLLRAIPVVILAAAMSYFIFTLVRDLISGVLLQFFAGVVLCFVSGCLYPPYFFPAAVQKTTIYLPTGAARSYLCGGSALLLLGYSLVFFLLGSSIYCYRIRRVKA